MNALSAQKFRRRAALAQMLLASSDPQKQVQRGGSSAAYEADAREIAEATSRFSAREELGLAIFQIFRKRYGQGARRFDTFSFAERLLEEISRQMKTL